MRNIFWVPSLNHLHSCHSMTHRKCDKVGLKSLWLRWQMATLDDGRWALENSLSIKSETEGENSVTITMPAILSSYRAWMSSLWPKPCGLLTVWEIVAVNNHLSSKWPASTYDIDKTLDNAGVPMTKSDRAFSLVSTLVSPSVFYAEILISMVMTVLRCWTFGSD